jgi:hypothetical protein
VTAARLDDLHPSDTNEHDSSAPQTATNRLRCFARTYGAGGLRRSRSVRRYTDTLIRARVAAAIAPLPVLPPSVTAATIKPAASTTSVLASQSRHHRGTLNSRCERTWAKHHEKARHGTGGIGAGHVTRPHNRTSVTARRSCAHLSRWGRRTRAVPSGTAGWFHPGCGPSGHRSGAGGRSLAIRLRGMPSTCHGMRCPTPPRVARNRNVRPSLEEVLELRRDRCPQWSRSSRV